MRLNRNDLEKELQCQDRGPVKSVTKEGKAITEICGRCKSVLHLIIMDKSKDRRLACPTCLQPVKKEGEDDPEEDWLKQHGISKGDKK